MNKIIEVQNVSVSYNNLKACENISFSIDKNQIIGIIGPNGSGKSTLVKAIMGLIKIDDGIIKIMDKPIYKIRKKIAYVPQRSNIDFDFPISVEEVVMMGRYPHMLWWKKANNKDKKIVKDSLNMVGVYEKRKNQIGELSGGEQQKVFLARALAQEAEILFLDEPFAGIDIASENKIMDILKKLKKEGKTLFVVHHDLNKAGNYFDIIILLKNKLIELGEHDKVLNINNLEKVYKDKISIINNNLMVANI